MSDSDTDDEASGPAQPQELKPAQVASRTGQTATSSAGDSDSEDYDRVAVRAAAKRKQLAEAATFAAASAKAADEHEREEEARWDEFEAFVAATSAAALPSDDDYSTGTPDIEDGQWSSLDKDASGREEVADEHTWAAPWAAQQAVPVAMPGVGGYFSVPAEWGNPSLPPAAQTWGQPQAATFAPPQAAVAAAGWPSMQPTSAAAGAGVASDVAQRMQASVAAPAFNPAGASSAAVPPKKRSFNPNAAAFNPGQF